MNLSIIYARLSREVNPDAVVCELADKNSIEGIDKDSLDAYRDDLRDARETARKTNRASEGKLNATKAHAAVMISEIFKDADSEACLLTGSLNKDVYGQKGVVDAVLKFLSKDDSSLKIIFEELSGNEADIQSLFQHPLLCAILKRNLGDRVEIKFVTTQDARDQIGSHCLVVDGGRTFRFEKNKKEPIAIGQFGNVEDGKILYGWFSNLWDTVLQNYNSTVTAEATA